ncbi:MAG: c-type cytochrome [Bryobacterales bacterium]|nr:c-type cytochrome [Bryobacterales bacterium]
MTVLVLALQLSVPLGLDAYIPTPETNPITRDMAFLGKRLFFDTALSRDRTVSCATCHQPDYAFADPHPRAIGLDGRKGPRRTPTILNRGYGKAFFWDGRAATLEDQVLGPIRNPDEMGMTVEAVLARIPNLTRDTLSRALATYVRTVLAGNSPYDRYIQGDKSALTAQQIAGLKLFRAKANCVACHVGPNLTDERFHNTGAGAAADHGRFTVTRHEEDRAAFKTPTLRQIAVRAPYMHDGSLRTLEEVIDFYDKAEPKPGLDPEIRPLHLTPQEKAALAAFLQSLSGVVKDGYE